MVAEDLRHGIVGAEDGLGDRPAELGPPSALGEHHQRDLLHRRGVVREVTADLFGKGGLLKGGGGQLEEPPETLRVLARHDEELVDVLRVFVEDLQGELEGVPTLFGIFEGAAQHALLGAAAEQKERRGEVESSLSRAQHRGEGSACRQARTTSKTTPTAGVDQLLAAAGETAPGVSLRHPAHGSVRWDMTPPSLMNQIVLLAAWFAALVVACGAPAPADDDDDGSGATSGGRQLTPLEQAACERYDTCGLQDFASCQADVLSLAPYSDQVLHCLATSSCQGLAANQPDGEGCGSSGSTSSGGQTCNDIQCSPPETEGGCGQYGCLGCNIYGRCF
jgi:hypothetical protein